MSSLLEAIRVVKDPRPIEPKRPVRDQWSPEEIERQASEAAGDAAPGMEGWHKAGALMAAYRLLHRQYLSTLARADMLQEQLRDCEAGVLPEVPDYFPERL